MSAYSPTDMARQLASGLLSFPVTHFRPDLSFDEAAYRENIGRLGGFGAAGLFAAGGTGEFFSLTPLRWSRWCGPPSRRPRTGCR